MRRVLHIFRGYILWKLLCIKYAINYKKIVLVLTGENELLDKNAVKYLDVFCDRKGVSKALVFLPQSNKIDWINEVSGFKDIQIVNIKDVDLDLLYDFYCFDEFFDNIVFTYTTKPEENMLGRVLAETEINEKDAVCLALYHLRYVVETE